MEKGLEKCPSQASSNVSESFESLTNNREENVWKMKEKMAEEFKPKVFEFSTSGVRLDLKLSNDDDWGDGSNLELNLFSSSSMESSPSSQSRKDKKGQENPKRSSEYRVFTCSFCKREFSTAQALGGHQNAHKQERALVKGKDGRLDMDVSSYSYYPYSNLSQISGFGSFNRSSLGVSPESLIQKPSYTWWSSLDYNYAFGLDKWSMPFISNLQESYDKIMMATNVQASNNNESGSSLATSSRPFDANGMPFSSSERDASDLDLNLKL